MDKPLCNVIDFALMLAILGTSLNSSNSSGAQGLIDVRCKEIGRACGPLVMTEGNAELWHLPVQIGACGVNLYV